MKHHTLQLTAIVLLTAYLVAVRIGYGNLKSISASFYAEGKAGYIFSATLIIIGLLALASFPTIWMMVSVFCLSVTAFGANYNQKEIGTPHVLGATASMVFGYIAVICVNPYSVIPAAITFVFFLWSRNRVWNSVYWTEVIGFYGVLVSLLFVN